MASFCLGKTLSFVWFIAADVDNMQRPSVLPRQLLALPLDVAMLRGQQELREARMVIAVQATVDDVALLNLLDSLSNVRKLVALVDRVAADWIARGAAVLGIASDGRDRLAQALVLRQVLPSQLDVGGVIAFGSAACVRHVTFRLKYHYNRPKRLIDQVALWCIR
jgi:hypothetical protein